MSITFTLPVPLKNQLGEPSVDGKPSENDHYDCVATSLASGLEYRLKRTFRGDQLKDAVYGDSYIGGQAAVRYVAYCAGLGVALQAINGLQDALLAALHREIHAGNPCLVTMPSMWGSAPSQPGWNPQSPNGWTHVGLACGDGPGMLRVMNPWGGFWHDGSDDYWRVRLCYGQVWRVGPVRQGGSMGIPAGWIDDGTTLKAPNGHVVRMGFRNFILSNPWDAADVPLEEERHLDPVEPQNVGLGGGQRQVFLKSVLRWNNAQEGVKLSWPGPALIARETELARANMDLGAANATIAQLKAQIAQLQQQPQADPLAAEALDVMTRQSALFAKLIPNAIRTATGGAIQP